jgi:hypothetical protein
MKSKNEDFGWDIDMTFMRAIKVMYWKIRYGMTWRSIAYLWGKEYPDEDNKDLGANQLYGMSVLDCAATKIGLKSYVSWPLNHKLPGWIRK